LAPNPSHVPIYPTVGIHPKYLSIYQNLNDQHNHLKISRNHANLKNKVVAVFECDLDETATAIIDHQLFVFEKQVDLANQFHLSIIFHCRSFHLYHTLYDCLKSRILDKYIPLHCHCINDPNQNILSYVHSSNINIKSMHNS
jgi:Tat protein secretion system quality control protein TatD with DNase activity